MAVTDAEQSGLVRTNGEQIRARRKRMGLRISELAEQAGVSRDTVSDWETGKRNPHPDTVEKVIAALESLEHEMGFDAPPAETGGSVVRFVVRGVYGAEALVVEGPVSDIAELEESVDRIMRRIQARAEADEGDS